MLGIFWSLRVDVTSQHYVDFAEVLKYAIHDEELQISA